MRKLLQVTLFFAAGVSSLCNAESTKPDTAVDDGRSDYRYVTTQGKAQTADSCTGFEAKYVLDHTEDASLKILPGQRVAIFLKNAYFSSVKGLFSTTAEAAILLNTDVNAGKTKKSSADYGKLIWYSEAISEESPINASFVPAATLTTNAATDTVVLDLSVVQFDSKNSALARGILRTMLNAARTAINPEAGAVLDTLGSSIVTSPEGGTRTLQYTLGFLLGHGVGEKMRQPILREGELVVITSPRRSADLKWIKLRFDHRSGLVYTDSHCQVPAKDFDYVVLSLRRDVNTGLDDARSQTLGDAIDAARSSSLSAQSAKDQVMLGVSNAMATDAAKHAMEEYNRTTDWQIKTLHLKTVLTTLACSASKQNKDACDGLAVSDTILTRALSARAVGAGVLCESDLTAIRKKTQPATGKTDASAIPTIVDELAADIMKKVSDNGQLVCPKPADAATATAQAK